jgi:hypothetical protein
MEPYLLTFACIFAVNLLPAFGPPTWALLCSSRFGTTVCPRAVVKVSTRPPRR